MGTRGPRPVSPGALYAFAHQLYWDFRKLAEGKYRWRVDEKHYKLLIDEAEEAQLTSEQKARLQESVEEELRAGRLRESEKTARHQDLEAGLLSATREWLRFRAGDEARKRLRIPCEPDVLEALLRAGTPQRVRRVCEDAFMQRRIRDAQGRMRNVEVPNWPISVGSVLPHYLSQYAVEFVAAKKDRRFPRSVRPSSQLKQLWFLSRALAGAIFGVKARTAINLVGSKRPEEIFEESRAGKSVRRKWRRK